ncbi:MAG: DegT/DnrJ/EryC1/StrS family aminotransferase [Planctomycetota bacterium]
MAVKLAINGGAKTVADANADMFTWPIITKEHEEAVLAVLRAGKMSQTDVTKEFEKEYAVWNKRTFGLATNNGTAALHSAMWACGVGVGTEIIGPSLTYWASVQPALSLGASVVFADVRPETLCIDPADIEHRITPRTKAIVVVHYCGYPCDMDPIMAIAKKHKVKVIEDVSHAHGGLYKGRLHGTHGDIAAMSLMAGKSLAIGEGGMIVTNDAELYERCVFFGHYERTTQTRWSAGTLEFKTPLKEYAGLPMGGFKYRMHQLSSAVGRVQLKVYDAQMAEIQKAMNYFWDKLGAVPGMKPHRPAKGSGSTMGGWYSAHGLYEPAELGGLTAEAFCAAVKAEGVDTWAGANAALHLHPLFHTADIYGHGKPTNLAFADRDLRQPKGSLPVTEAIQGRCLGIPWFKHHRPAVIDQYVAAFRKVIDNAGAVPRVPAAK